MDHKPSETPPDSRPDPATHHPEPVDMSEESVAGEEDPGASLDTGTQEPARKSDMGRTPSP